MYEDLTKKQLEIFEFMKKEQRQKGYLLRARNR